MIEEELIKIWQSSPQQEQVKFEKSRLMIDVESNIKRFHRHMKMVYLGETIGALFIIPVFTYYAFVIPFMLSKIASILVALWGVFLIMKMKDARNNKPGDYSDNYLKYLIKSREYLKVIKKLSDNVIYWYILPPISFGLLFTMGFLGIPEKKNYVIGMCIYLLVMVPILYFNSKRAVRKKVIPNLDKVNGLIKTLEE